MASRLIEVAETLNFCWVSFRSRKLISSIYFLRGRRRHSNWRNEPTGTRLKSSFHSTATFRLKQFLFTYVHLLSEWCARKTVTQSQTELNKRRDISMSLTKKKLWKLHTRSGIRHVVITLNCHTTMIYGLRVCSFEDLCILLCSSGWSSWKGLFVDYLIETFHQHRALKLSANFVFVLVKVRLELSRSCYQI